MSVERIATLEAQRQADREHVSELRDKLEDVHADVLAIKSRLDKQKGYIAGALSVLTAIWAVVGAVAYLLWQWFTKRGDLP
jgi:hypothetical protein